MAMYFYVIKDNAEQKTLIVRKHGIFRKHFAYLGGFGIFSMLLDRFTSYSTRVTV